MTTSLQQLEDSPHVPPPLPKQYPRRHTFKLPPPFSPLPPPSPQPPPPRSPPAPPPSPINILPSLPPLALLDSVSQPSPSLVDALPAIVSHTHIEKLSAPPQPLSPKKSALPPPPSPKTHHHLKAAPSSPPKKHPISPHTQTSCKLQPSHPQKQQLVASSRLIRSKSHHKVSDTLPAPTSRNAMRRSETIDSATLVLIAKEHEHSLASSTIDPLPVDNLSDDDANKVFSEFIAKKLAKMKRESLESTSFGEARN